MQLCTGRSLVLVLALASLSSLACGGGGGGGGTTDPDSELCAGIGCSGHGDCVVEQGAPACHCDADYVASGLSCTPAATGAGSCTLSENVGGVQVTSCTAYTGSAWASGDVVTACHALGGAYTTGCATAGLIGICRLAVIASQEVHYYYYAPQSPANLAQACTLAGGTWSAP